MSGPTCVTSKKVSERTIMYPQEERLNQSLQNDDGH